MASHVFKLLSEFQPLVGRVYRTDGECHRALRVFAHSQRGTHGGLDVAQIVHGVEDAKDIDAICGRTFDEGVHDIVGIVAVSEDVLPAKQHLKPRVGHGPADQPKPFPRIFPEISNARVERRATPNLGRPVTHAVQLFADRQHILDAHPRGDQRLVAVA